MKNLKQLILPCYKVELAMSVEAWYFLHGTTGGVCNLTYFLSLLSKMAITEVQNTKRGLSYTLHPGQVDSSMLVLAKEWNIGRKAVSRLLDDFSERGLVRVDSNPMTSIIDMVCVKSWMIVGRLMENPTYNQVVKCYEGVRIFLFNGQKLETLRHSSARKKAEKPTDKSEALPSANTADSSPLIEVAEADTIVPTGNGQEYGQENVSDSMITDADNTPVLGDEDTSSVSQDRKQTQE